MRRPKRRSSHYFSFIDWQARVFVAEKKRGQAAFLLGPREGRRGSFPGPAAGSESMLQVVAGRGDALPGGVAVRGIAIHGTTQRFQFACALRPINDFEPIQRQGQRPIRQRDKRLGVKALPSP